MGGTMTGGQRTATSRQAADSRKLSRLRRHYRGSTALSNRALFWGAPLVGAALLSAVPAAGNPTGGTVVGGSATIGGEGTSNVTVNQTTDRAILHWEDFSIGAGETTQFIQPGTDSIAVNRVTGTAQSLLLGTLTANGNVWIINPNGLTAGAGSIIDVNGFLASTADILDSDILDGDNRFSFNIPSANPDASIVNLGQISVGERGLGALVAPGVENDGLIVGRMAQVVLAGAETFALDFAGDGLLSFEIASPVTSAPDGMTDLVSNSGVIDAPGGFVLLTADSIDGVVDNVINMSGVIQAQTLTTANGQVVLSGGDNGIVRVSGTIDASGTDAGETGGEVNVLGQLVALDLGATIDASGDAGGGTVLVGGGFQGNGPQPNAEQTIVSQDASIAADALTTGDGGTVVVWSDDYTQFYGSITARGGASGGNGGLAEISGKNGLTFAGAADLSAPYGEFGTLLFDPLDIVVGTDGTDGANGGTIGFGDNPAAEPWHVTPTQLDDIKASIILQANNDITVEEPIALTTAAATLSFEAGDNIVLMTGANISTTDGAISFTANAAGGSESGGGDAGSVKMAAGTSVNAGNQDIVISAEGDVELGSLVTTGNVTVTSTAGAIVDADASDDSTANVTADLADLRGFTGVGGTAAGADIDTDVTTLIAIANNSGDVVIDEASAITLGSGGIGTSTLVGDIFVTAGDAISLGFLMDANNDGNITLTAEAGDIAVDFDITSTLGSGAGVGLGAGTITLDAEAGAITGAASIRAAAGSANLQAATGIGSVGTPFQTEVTSLAADLDTAFADMFVNNTGILTIDSVGTQDGIETVNGDVTLTTSTNTLILAQDIITGTGVLSGNADAISVISTNAEIGDAIELANTNAAIDVSPGDYGETLTVSDDLNFTFQDTVVVSSFTSNAGTTIGLEGSLSTDGGNLTFNGDVTLTGNTILDTDAAGDVAGQNAGDVLFAAAGNVDAAATGSQGLTIDATTDNTGGAAAGTVALGAVGQNTALASLTVSGNTTTLNGDIATDGGNVDLSGAPDVDLAAALVTIDTDAAGDAAGQNAGDVLFAAAGNVDATATGSQGLTIDATTDNTGGAAAGTVALGAVGQNAALASLTVSGNTTTLNGDIATDGGNVDLSGAPDVDLAAALVTIDTDATGDAAGQNAGDVLFAVAGNVDATATGSQGLTIDATTDNTGGAAAGTVALGAVGQNAALASLTVSGNTTTLNGDIATDGGNVDLSGAPDVDLAAALVTIDTDATGDAAGQNAGDVLFAAAGNVDAAATGSQGLTIDATTDNTGGAAAGTVALGAVGQNAALASLDVDGGETTLNGDIATEGGEVNFAGTSGVLLASTVRVDTDQTEDTAPAGAITFGSVDGAQTLTLDATGTGTDGSGTVTLGAVGQNTQVASLDVDAGTIAPSGDISADGGPVSLTATAGLLSVTDNIDSNGGLITLEGTGVSIGASTEVDAGTGSIDIDGGSGNIDIGDLATVLSDNGTIDVTGGSISVNGGAQIGGSSAGIGQAANVVLRPTGGTTIAVGNGAAGAFNLTDTELDTIRTQDLQIGDATSGAIEVGTWTLASDIGGAADDSVSLTTNAGITQIGALDLNDTDLIVRAVGDVELNNSGNDFGEVAADVTGGTGSISITNADALTVAELTDNIGTVTGVQAAGDVDIFIETDNARLTNTTTIQSTTGNVTLLADEMTLQPGTVVDGAIVTLAPNNDPGDTYGIDIGSGPEGANNVANSLELSIVELGTVDAPILRVGNVDTGDIEITATVVEGGVPNVDLPSTLSLVSSGVVSQTAAITVDDLNLNIVADEVSLTAANDIGSLSVNTTAATGGAGSTGSVHFVNDDVGDDADLTIDAVDTGTGIVAVGPVTLESDGLTISEAIAASGQTVTLLPVGADQTIGIAAAGDLEISDAELGNITAARLILGNAANTTDITAGTITAGNTAGIGRIDIRNSGTLTFNGAVNGSFDLFMQSGGDIVFNSTFGTAATPLGIMLFETPGDVSLAADPFTGARYFADILAINVGGDFTSGQLNPTATTFEPVNVETLIVFNADEVRLFGSIAGDSTTSAAPQGIAVGGQDADWQFNGCVIGGSDCFDIPLILPVSGLDLSLEDERLLREPLVDDEEEFEDLLSNTGNEELW